MLDERSHSFLGVGAQLWVSCSSAQELRAAVPGLASCTSSWSSGRPASSLGDTGGWRSSSPFCPLFGDCTPLPGHRPAAHTGLLVSFLPSCFCFLTFQEAPSEEVTPSPHPRRICLWTQVATHSSEVSSLPGAPRMCPPGHRGLRESCQPQGKEGCG